MPKTSSKRLREKSSALQEYLRKTVSLRIDETKVSRKPPLHLHKRDAIIRDCTVNYVNIEVRPAQPRIVHTEWNSGEQEDLPIHLHPGKILSIPLEDIKLACDIDNDRLLVIISRTVWDLSAS